MTVVPENSLDMFKTERSSYCLKVETPQSKNHITRESLNQKSVLKTCAVMLYLVQKTLIWMLFIILLFTKLAFCIRESAQYVTG